MAEQLRKEEIYNHFTPAEQLEEAIKSVDQAALKMSHERFETHYEAHQRGVQFMNEHSLSIAEIPNVHEISVRLSGDTVLNPVAGFSSIDVGTTTKKGLAMIYDVEELVKRQDEYDHVVGEVSGFWHTVRQAEDGRFAVSPYIVATLDKVERGNVFLPESTVSLIELNIVRRALVELNGKTRITALELEDVRHRDQILKDMSRLSLSNTDFKYYLDKLPQLFHNDSPEEYVPVKNLKLIHRLGSLGADMSRKDSENSSVVTSALNHVIKPGRLMLVDYLTPFSDHILDERQVKGHFVHASMPSGPNDDSEPALVIERIQNGEATNDLKLIPFKDITALKF